MINTSEEYKAAVVGPVRRTRIRIPLRGAPAGVVYGSRAGDNQASVSRAEETTDGIMTLSDRYASLERNRWLLDGTVTIPGDDYSHDGEVGLVSNDICEADGAIVFAHTLRFTGVEVLQTVTVVFPGGDLDGYARNVTLLVLQGYDTLYTATRTGNTDTTVVFAGFTAYEPTGIMLVVNGWSMPLRRVRIAEIAPGLAVDWTERDLTALTVTQRASFNAVSLPYGTASLTIDNQDRQLDGWLKSGAALRAKVPVEIGVDTENGTEYIPVGTYYHHGQGSWTARDGGATSRWDLVDVVGLMTETVFSAPDTLPTTLEGWVKALVAALGDDFPGGYTVDPDYAETALTATKSAVDGQRCGDILRWICQASGTFPRADAETGDLAVEPLWNQGNEYGLDNLEEIPAASANDSIGTLTFQLPAGDLVMAGNMAASTNTLRISNPFITTQTLALVAARHILSAYGGSRIQLTGRGDPTSEIGDVATVEVAPSEAATARLASQTLEFSGGVLRGCRAELIQADGTFLYENREVITESGDWTAPAGVTTLYIVLVGGGQSGGHGKYGTYNDDLFATMKGGWIYGSRGATGSPGDGGKVWYGTVHVNEGQTVAVTVGAGGQPGTGDPVDGGDTTFGAYSSGNGHVYSPSYTDIASGSAYGRSGINAPAANSGDGGAGGAGGSAGAEYYQKNYDEHGNWKGSVTRTDYIPPGAGYDGTPGAAGCVIIYYDKEASA